MVETEKWLISKKRISPANEFIFVHFSCKKAIRYLD